MGNTRKPEPDPAAIGRRVVGELDRQLASRAPPADSRVLIAFSGGLDSSVLLHAGARLADSRRIAAIHIDHGWHNDSAKWARHCRDIASGLGLVCEIRRIDARPAPGESAEAAARLARYEAFAAAMTAGDVLVTAHHGDDQLETVLLRLLRGTGVRGMRAIHEESRLGAGILLRPLLPFSRRELESLAAHWRVAALADPSNDDRRFDRNFLRAEVVPQLRERWPGAHTVANRVAAHMRDAESLLGILAELDGGNAAEPDRFPVARLAALEPLRRVNLLRHLIARCGIGVPGERQLTELLRQLREAPERAIHVAWHDGEARVFRGHLYLMRPLAAAEQRHPAGVLKPGSAWQGGAGHLTLVPTGTAGIPQHIAEQGLRVEFRRGGERFVPAGSAHHKTIKHWFQERGIVPWMRENVPLLYSGDELVAIADLALAAMPRSDREPAWRPVWDAPRRVR